MRGPTRMVPSILLINDLFSKMWLAPTESLGFFRLRQVE